MLKRNQKAKRTMGKRGIMPSDAERLRGEGASRKRTRPETIETVGGTTGQELPAVTPAPQATGPCIHEADPDTAIQANLNPDYAVVAIAGDRVTQVMTCRKCHVLFVPEAA